MCKNVIPYVFIAQMHFFSFDYKTDNVVLHNFSSVKDLGVTFYYRLNFKEHVSYILSKSLRLLGFIKRNSSDFRNPFTLKTLYISLVRPHLEYCCIWNPLYIITQILKLKTYKKTLRGSF